MTKGRLLIKRGGRGQKQTWHKGIRDGKEETYFTCACGAGGPLEGHVVGTDGVVVPSVHHDIPSCGFHHFITLEGYTDGT